MKHRRGLVSLLQDTWHEFNRDEASMLGAAMAFWAVLSLVPVLLLLLALFGWLLSFWPVALDAKTELLQVVTKHFGPQLGHTIAGLLDNIQEGSGAATGIGLVFLLFSAAGVFRQLRVSFRKIWGWRPPETAGLRQTIRFNVLEQLGAMTLALCTGAAFLLSFLITAGSQALRQYLGPRLGTAGSWQPVVEPLAVLLLSIGVFLLLYKFLPPVRVRWRDVWLGALLAAFLWEIGKRILTLYLLLFPLVGPYGAAGLLLVVMIWVYVSCQILFIGAEFCKIWVRTGPAPPLEQPGGQEVMQSTEAMAERT